MVPFACFSVSVGSNAWDSKRAKMTTFIWLPPPAITIDLFRYIEIQSNTIDLSARLWGIHSTNFVVIHQSLVLRPIVLGWIWIYRIWSIPRLKNIFPSGKEECDWQDLFVRMPPYRTERSIFDIVLFKDTLLWYCAPRPWRTSGSADVVIVIRVFSFQLVVFIFAALCVAYIRLGVATDMFCCDVNIIGFRSARKTEVTQWDG